MSSQRRQVRHAVSALVLCVAALAVAPPAHADSSPYPGPGAVRLRAVGDVTLTGGSFGEVAVGQSGTVVLILANHSASGSAGFDGIPLTLPPGVTRTGGTCDLEAALVAGDSCTIELTWTPTAEGPYTGTVSLTADEDPNPPYTVSAQVSGTTPVTPTAPPSPSPSHSATPTATAPATVRPSRTASTAAASPSRNERPRLASTGSSATRATVIGTAGLLLVAAGAVLVRLRRSRRGTHQ